MSPEVKKIFEQIAQKDLALVGTRAAIGALRCAREKNHSSELCLALFELAQKMAIAEWGDDARIDDFSRLPHYVVSNGKKKMLV